MWLLLAFGSAALLGLYDFSKKVSLSGNAVIPILFLNVLFCSLFFIPCVTLSAYCPSVLEDSFIYIPPMTGQAHLYILLKSVIVLSSWIAAYFSMKHLPLSIAGPIRSAQPVLTLLGALLVYGECLNGYQWMGVGCALIAFFLLSRSGRKEGIRFSHNRWILFLVIGTILGSISGLYDKFLMQRFDKMGVQAWYNIYQLGWMIVILLAIWWPRRHHTTPFEWRWSIVFISIFLTAADMLYFKALSETGAMISIVSMIRRSSVIVSFGAAALFLHEKNISSKVVDLILLLLGMVFLYWGSI